MRIFGDLWTTIIWPKICHTQPKLHRNTYIGTSDFFGTNFVTMKLGNFCFSSASFL
jgi:hypothetical protein